MVNRQMTAIAIVVLLALVSSGSAGGEPHAVLGLDLTAPARRGWPVFIPVHFTFEDTTVTALTFSIDVDVDRLHFRPDDHDMDGVPDAVTLPAGMPSLVYVGFDRDDDGGELDFMLANLSGAPLPQGVVLKIRMRPLSDGDLSSWMRFSADPPPSFGNDQGQSVDGTTVVFGRAIFADGFESGDTSAWSRLGGAP